MSIFRYEVRIRSQTLQDIGSQQTFLPIVKKKKKKKKKDKNKNKKASPSFNASHVTPF